MAKKMFYKVLIAGNLLMLPASVCISAQTVDPSLMPALNSPLSQGYLQRAQDFKEEANWAAVADQVRMALDSRESFRSEELEELDYLNILAAYNLGTFDSMTLISDFEKAYPASLHLPEVRYLNANLLFFNKEYSAALRAYNEINPSSLSPRDRTDYTYHKAVAMLRTGYYEEARPLFASLSSKDGYANAALFYDAYIDYVNGDYREAYSKFKRVPESAENGLEADYYLAQIDFKDGNYQEVIEEAERLLKRNADPTLVPETMRIGGISYFKTGDTTRAKALLEKYVEETGEAAENTARYTLGTIYYDEGEYELARQQFARLTDDRNDLTQSSWLYLGQIAAAESDEQQAAIAFDKAARMAFNSEIAETSLYNLAVTGANGKGVPFKSSSAALENFVATYPNSPYVPTVSSYLATSYFNEKNYEKALESISKIKNPSRDVLQARQKILYELGMKQFSAGELDKAIVSLKDAAASASINPEIAAQAYVWLGDAYYLKKQYAASSEAYSAALATKKTGGNTSIAQYNLGYALMKQKDYRNALSHFKAALADKGLSASQQKDARLRIADCQYYLGNHKEALAGFRSLSGGSGQDAVYASLREAELIGRDGDVIGKIEILQKLDRDGDTGLWTQEILTSLAGAYTEVGNDADAAKVNSRILESNPSESTTIQTLYALAENAENLYEKEDYANALAAYRTLEESGYSDFYPLAIEGIMRSSASPAEIIEYADKVISMPGVSAELSEEALFSKAVAMIDLDEGNSREEGLVTLQQLADNPTRDWGAMAALNLGQYYLDADQPETAEDILLQFVDSDTDNQYLLAKGYILLSDAYAAKGDDYLARLYIESLRDNYPGKEPEILEMINTRLKNLR